MCVTHANIFCPQLSLQKIPESGSQEGQGPGYKSRLPCLILCSTLNHKMRGSDRTIYGHQLRGQSRGSDIEFTSKKFVRSLVYRADKYLLND